MLKGIKTGHVIANKISTKVELSFSALTSVLAANQLSIYLDLIRCSHHAECVLEDLVPASVNVNSCSIIAAYS